MRPAYLRRDNDLLRSTRDDRYLRPLDRVALILGYGLLLSVFVAGVISLVDWLQGNPHTVLPKFTALLDWLDRGAR